MLTHLFSDIQLVSAAHILYIHTILITHHHHHHHQHQHLRSPNDPHLPMLIHTKLPHQSSARLISKSHTTHSPPIPIPLSPDWFPNICLLYLYIQHHFFFPFPHVHIHPSARPCRSLRAPTSKCRTSAPREQGSIVRCKREWVPPPGLHTREAKCVDVRNNGSESRPHQFVPYRLYTSYM